MAHSLRYLWYIINEEVSMDFANILHFFSRFFAYFQSGTEMGRQHSGIVWDISKWANAQLTAVNISESIRCNRTNNDNTAPTVNMIALPLRIVNSFCRFFAFLPGTSQNMTYMLIFGQLTAVWRNAETPKTQTKGHKFLCWLTFFWQQYWHQIAVVV